MSLFIVNKHNRHALIVPEHILFRCAPEIAQRQVAFSVISLEFAVIAGLSAGNLERIAIFRASEITFKHLSVFELCIQIFRNPCVFFSSDSEFRNLASETIFKMLNILLMHCGRCRALANQVACYEVFIVFLKECFHGRNHAGHAEKQNLLSAVKQGFCIFVNTPFIDLGIL